ncbi:hypothetical protein DEA8626_03621 [Defluviimonas aquaemixtae]|uniref:DUF1554 domain-containing protein n=1 Tax=Albidovulum aquaemixtae TaxID=1542388 RepID=A0A2R8BMC5_9RHOB|nr:DUF1554 domain-containing protein [Defluviimonas aquaemixtae]SPH24569.1 hypothetical protein DEA8626_03621 [Defluviimonas aquaemixtae]
MIFRTITAAAFAVAASAAGAQDAGMSFFVTSENPGSGGNFGGIEGADAHCASLAEAAGVTGKTWRAYLSTSGENARDRIGAGPWVNAAGTTIAESVDQLHSPDANLTKESALNEMGELVNGRGDDPNRHDILTGSMPDGTVAEGMTCEDWTSDGAEAAGMVGHHDRMGLDDSDAAKSWNSSHSSRGGCGLEALRGTGGDGLVYCFATN